MEGLNPFSANSYALLDEVLYWDKLRLTRVASFENYVLSNNWQEAGIQAENCKASNKRMEDALPMI